MIPPLLSQRINLFKIVEQYGSLKAYMLAKGMIKKGEDPMIVGVFHAGGAASGANAGIRQLLMGRRENTFVLAFEDGCDGLMNGSAVFLSPQNTWGQQLEGGVMIGSVRTNPTSKQRDKIKSNLEAWGIYALFAMGGDDTQTTAQRLGIPTIGIPKTIDSDLPFTESYGHKSFVKHACDTISGLIRDAGSRNAWTISQLMGRKSGRITMKVSETVEATHTFIREEFSITGILELAEVSRRHRILRKKLENITRIIRVEGKAFATPAELIKCVKELKPLKDEEKLTIDLDALVQQLIELIVQRARVGARYGLINIAEGLIDKLPLKITEYDEASYPKRGILEDISAPDKREIKFDPHHNPKLSKINLAEEIARRIEAKLPQELARQGIEAAIDFLPIPIGHGERSKPPISEDVNLAKVLADKAMELLYQGKFGRMVTYWKGKLGSIPYEKLPVDSKGHIIPRSVSLKDPSYLSVAVMELHKRTLAYLVPPENPQG
jgi:6-phosphofructokinase